MAWSNRINTPEFQAIVSKQKSKNNKFAIVFIIAPLIILPIIGIVQDDFTSYALGGVALTVLIALFFFFSKIRTKYQRSWEGTVTDKYQKEEERYDRTHDSRDRHVYDKYNYVIIKEDGGKVHKIKDEANRWSLEYEYLNVGDRVRFHGGMDLKFPYEKFDKSADTITICPFCTHKNSPAEAYCTKCHNPLLN